MILEHEDRALKLKLSGLTVTDLKTGAGTRPVDVWFRFPDKEIRDVRYPFITIDFGGLRKAGEREHRGTPIVNYRVGGMSINDETAATALRTDEFPVPYELYYTVTVWSRNPLHDRQLVAKLLSDPELLPFRNGYLEVPEDDSIRRLDVLGMQPANIQDRTGKRLFRKIINLTVSAEIFPSQITEVRKPTVVDLDLDDLAIDVVLARNPAVP